MLDLNELAKLINSKVSNASAKVINPAADGAGDSSIEVSAASIVDVATMLKDNPSFSFNALQVISGTDFPDHLEVAYIFTNFDPNKFYDLILKVKLIDKTNPTLATISHIYQAANWQERECYDMIGVTFTGHPDPRRILCPDDWEGFPLRKDYKVQESYRGMIVNPEEKMNWGDRQFADRQAEIAKAQGKASKK